LKFLTIDTALNKTFLSLYIEGKTVTKTIESDDSNYHSAYLIMFLEEMFKENKIKPENLDYIGANTGVGSFTGIRVALTVLKVMASRLNKDTVPLTTTEILSRAYNNKNIMIDARRNSVFYSSDGKNTVLISYDKAIEILKDGGNFIADDCLIKNENFAEFRQQFVSYEENTPDLGKFEAEIAKEKIERGETLHPLKVKPAYIQTPPVFIKYW